MSSPKIKLIESEIKKHYFKEINQQKMVNTVTRNWNSQGKHSWHPNWGGRQKSCQVQRMPYAQALDFTQFKGSLFQVQKGISWEMEDKEGGEKDEEKVRENREIKDV